MEITYDLAKRALTRMHRGLDFAEADRIFSGETALIEDVRHDYPEPRFLSVGFLDGRMVVLVWTPTPKERRIVSMRHTHERETRKWLRRMGRSG